MTVSVLCLTGLGWWVSDRALRQVLSTYGDVEDVEIAAFPSSGKSSGCATVKFSTSSSDSATSQITSGDALKKHFPNVSTEFRPEPQAQAFLASMSRALNPPTQESSSGKSTPQNQTPVQQGGMFPQMPGFQGPPRNFPLPPGLHGLPPGFPVPPGMPSLPNLPPGVVPPPPGMMPFMFPPPNAAGMNLPSQPTRHGLQPGSFPPRSVTGNTASSFPGPTMGGNNPAPLSGTPMRNGGGRNERAIAVSEQSRTNPATMGLGPSRNESREQPDGAAKRQAAMAGVTRSGSDAAKQKEPGGGGANTNHEARPRGLSRDQRPKDQAEGSKDRRDRASDDPENSRAHAVSSGRGLRQEPPQYPTPGTGRFQNPPGDRKDSSAVDGPSRRNVSLRSPQNQRQITRDENGRLQVNDVRSGAEEGRSLPKKSDSRFQELDVRREEGLSGDSRGTDRARKEDRTRAARAEYQGNDVGSDSPRRSGRARDSRVYSRGRQERDSQHDDGSRERRRFSQLSDEEDEDNDSEERRLDGRRRNRRNHDRDGDDENDSHAKDTGRDRYRDRDRRAESFRRDGSPRDRDDEEYDRTYSSDRDDERLKTYERSEFRGSSHRDGRDGRDERDDPDREVVRDGHNEHDKHDDFDERDVFDDDGDYRERDGRRSRDSRREREYGLEHRSRGVRRDRAVGYSSESEDDSRVRSQGRFRTRDDDRSSARSPVQGENDDRSAYVRDGDSDRASRHENANTGRERGRERGHSGDRERERLSFRDYEKNREYRERGRDHNFSRFSNNKGSRSPSPDQASPRKRRRTEKYYARGGDVDPMDRLDQGLDMRRGGSKPGLDSKGGDDSSTRPMDELKPRGANDGGADEASGAGLGGGAGEGTRRVRKRGGRRHKRGLGGSGSNNGERHQGGLLGKGHRK